MKGFFEVMAFAAEMILVLLTPTISDIIVDIVLSIVNFIIIYCEH